MHRHAPTRNPLLVAFIAALAIGASTACESQSAAEQRSDDEATERRSKTTSSGGPKIEEAAEKPTLPERSAPDRHDSACARQPLSEIDMVAQDADAPKSQYVHAKILLNSCGDALPSPLRTWLRGVTDDDRPPRPQNIEGMDDVFADACPAGPSVLETTEDLGWRKRLETLWARCGFSALQLATLEEFLNGTGPEASAMAMVLYRWMVADGVKVGLAKRAARGLANFDGDRFYASAGELLSERPDFRPIRSTSDRSPDEHTPIVVGPDGLWSDGRRTVAFGDALQPSQPLEERMRTLAASREQRAQPPEEPMRMLADRAQPLQIAVSADAPYVAASKVIYAARGADMNKFRFLVSTSEDLSGSGAAGAPREWETQFRVINAVAPRPPEERERDRKRRRKKGVPVLEWTVAIREHGFRVTKSGEPVSAGDGCARDGVTICLADAEADDPVERYDWAELYKVGYELHAVYPGEPSLDLTADRDLPFRLAVRAIDVLRYERETEHGQPLHEIENPTNEDLDRSSVKECRMNGPCEMFPHPVFSTAI